MTPIQRALILFLVIVVPIGGLLLYMLSLMRKTARQRRRNAEELHRIYAICCENLTREWQARGEDIDGFDAIVTGTEVDYQPYRWVDNVKIRVPKPKAGVIRG